MKPAIRLDHRGCPHEPEEPGWKAGGRVRLVRPDNPGHPARGRVGTIVRARFFDAVYRSRGLDPDSELTCPSVWLLWVRFGDTGDDRYCYGLFGREVERVEGA